jgi:serine/threonine protein kinase
MPIQFPCSDCGKTLSCKDELLGKKVRCPSCRTVVQVPDHPPAAQASSEYIGEYQIVGKLGQGGMGVVYEAIQDKLNRRVALKVISAQAMENETYVKRFKREAQAAAALNHPHIIGVYDIGEDVDRHYFSMEFVDGESVQEKIQREGKIPLEETLRIVGDVVKALRYAKEQNFIHRDIKPENIMLTQSGVVKLADLGLAKNTEEEFGLTATGTGLGTPYYMAPEQSMDAAHVEFTADIYALGITTLHMLTGKRPYDSHSAIQIVRMHLQDPLLSGKDLGTLLPEAIETLIQKMCDKEPENRHADYQELQDEIKAIQGGDDDDQNSEAKPKKKKAKKKVKKKAAKKTVQKPAKRKVREPVEEQEPDDEEEEAPASSGRAKKGKKGCSVLLLLGSGFAAMLMTIAVLVW